MNTQQHNNRISKKCASYPEIIVTRTRRSSRIIIVALSFVASYLIMHLILLKNGNNDYSNVVVHQHYSNRNNVSSSSSIVTNNNNNNNVQPTEKIHIFYNLFTKNAQEEDRVRKIVEEQFGNINPTLHDVNNISITSIGHRLSNMSITKHYNTGGEDITLHALWEYCKHNNHTNTKVIYLHSKGSYHPNEANNKLRNFVTRGALSTECANLPHDCNVCSSRMSPLPHPHTSGNMWLARCDYISRLFDPLLQSATATTKMKNNVLSPQIHEDNPCMGRGRYLGEHWVHSHPTVMPCDLYPGSEFTWAHLRVPPIEREWKKELVQAPRFKFHEYVLPGMCMDEYPESLSIADFVRLRIQNYELLYNITELDSSWWGWEFLKRSIS